MDPACRQKIYCDPTPEQGAGSSAKTLSSTRQSTHQPPLCHPDRVYVYETDRKKCKLWQGYSRIPRLEGEEIALSAVHIFCADGCGQGEIATETSLSGIFG